MKAITCKSNNSSKVASFVDSFNNRLKATNKHVDRYSINILPNGRTTAIIYYS